MLDSQRKLWTRGRVVATHQCRHFQPVVDLMQCPETTIRHSTVEKPAVTVVQSGSHRGPRGQAQRGVLRPPPSCGQMVKQQKVIELPTTQIAREIQRIWYTAIGMPLLIK